MEILVTIILSAVISFAVFNFIAERYVVTPF
jgi:hypothetical protein